MKKIRIGSRESKLAVIQAELVIAAIRSACPEVEPVLVTMKTTGDKILDRTLDQVGGKGLFVKELDAALLDERVDFTVHSLKDLPMETDPRLPIVAVSSRADPRDALVLPEGVDRLDSSKPVGCASLRRKLQLERLYPGIRVEPVRGNLQTRLRKLDEGQYSALILAAAGLKRLGIEKRISRFFSTDEMIPAACQGILAVQARRGESSACLKQFHDAAVWPCALAERAYVRALDGGCSSPVAAYATLRGREIVLEGMDSSGRRERISGPVEQAQALGAALAAQSV